MSIPQLKPEQTYLAREVHVVPTSGSNGPTLYQDVGVRLNSTGTWLSVISGEGGDETVDAYPAERVAGVFGLAHKPSPPARVVNARLG